MERIGIVGLGAMGLGIAQVYAQAGHTVVAFDASTAVRESSLDRLRSSLEPRVASGKLPAEELALLLDRIAIAPDLSALAPCDLVIEAVIEDFAAKRDLLREIEAMTAPKTVLATNTSALSVGALAHALTRPENLVGLHFFNPAPVMRLVELVAHKGASPEALSLARTLTGRAGKEVIACADSPGFIVNRCARPYYGEALALLEEGRSASDIDAAMLAAGYRMGPFSLIDLVGADINLAATRGLSAAMTNHPRYHVFKALEDQVSEGRLGRKSGKGFLFPATPGPAPADAAAIQLRIEATLANEAATLVEAGGAAPDDIDRAMRLGLNFPRGPFEGARRHGRESILSELVRLARLAPARLAGRYAICDNLPDLI
ncbi:3-hydroxyacyl-CoA dehydrogenase NAD-binding domain-containing protein [Frigidibacter sp. RF13]|uniref:3-hydroxyacyl-CoA dehydrogenase n=1 Tax=Frigidibacter sp. RF13 TaxID=2997340 RepID=UPI00226DF4B2|nr:3-hydroxyacyl-CoA dehydrogenase NAD-binding domain-containing protein [Frigidibacter sp. RF13]MCY1125261.1 3-hydroxyacyl-CoA dehydrogenase NAD-binding domain-containing protein [Frigidibacter sp. RF13]